MRVTHRVMSLLAVGMIGVSSTAQAQDIFTTQGFFSTTLAGLVTCTNGVAASSCTEIAPAGATLAINFIANTLTDVPFGPSDNIFAPPADVTLGSFFLSGSGNIPAGVLDGNNLTFTLMITETSPLPGGSNTTIGGITGSVTRPPVGAPSGGLLWTPNPVNVLVNGATYRLAVDKGTNGIAISAGGASTINARLTRVTTPEPASMALFATGLAGLIPVAIRRRKNTK